MVHHLSKIKGMCPALVSNRTLERATSALRDTGVEPSRIKRCDDPDAATRALQDGCRVVTTEPTLPAFVPVIDVILEDPDIK